MQGFIDVGWEAAFNLDFCLAGVVVSGFVGECWVEGCVSGLAVSGSEDEEEIVVWVRVSPVYDEDGEPFGLERVVAGFSAPRWLIDYLYSLVGLDVSDALPSIIESLARFSRPFRLVVRVNDDPDKCRAYIEGLCRSVLGVAALEAAKGFLEGAERGIYQLDLRVHVEPIRGSDLAWPVTYLRRFVYYLGKAGLSLGSEESLLLHRLEERARQLRDTGLMDKYSALLVYNELRPRYVELIKLLKKKISEIDSVLRERYEALNELCRRIVVEKWDIPSEEGLDG